MEKFNGYETIKHVLARQEMREFVPIDIVYKPIFDESVPVSCFFNDKIYSAYRSYIGQMSEGKECIRHTTVGNVIIAIIILPRLRRI